VLLYYIDYFNRITYLAILSDFFYCVIHDLHKYTVIKHQHYPFCLADNNAPGLKSVNPVTHPTVSPEPNHRNSNLSYLQQQQMDYYWWKQALLICHWP